MNKTKIIQFRIDKETFDNTQSKIKTLKLKTSVSKYARELLLNDLISFNCPSIGAPYKKELMKLDCVDSHNEKLSSNAIAKMVKNQKRKKAKET